MPYRGSGQPQIVRLKPDGTVMETVTLPRPLKDGREETWENKTETFTNIKGEIISGAPKYRFKASYEFGNVYDADGDNTGVGGGLIDFLATIYNTKAQIRLIPHDDAKYVCYDVVIEDLQVPKWNGLVYWNNLKVDFVSVNFVKAIPTIDNMLGIVMHNRIFGLEEPDA